MIDQFTKLAREAVIKEDLKNAGIRMNPEQTRATVELNLRLQPKIHKALGGRVASRENMSELQAITYECVHETFRECAEYFRAAGDWEAFGEIHFMRGRS